MTSPCARASTVRRCSWAADPMQPFAAHGARTSIMSIRAVTNPRGKRTNEGSCAAAGRGMIYLCFLFRSGGFCPLCKSQFCPCPYKIRQPYCPPRSVYPLPICPSCRCRSQPLPGDSRKQRYNTLDFPMENRVPTGMLLAPIGNPEQRGYSPLDTLLFLAAMVSTLSKLGGFHAVKNVKSEKHFHHRVVVLRFSYMGYCLVFANSHVSAMAKAEERTIFV